MKIYNVIEWKWNDKTNKMEEVYSDGYEYETIFTSAKWPYWRKTQRTDDPYLVKETFYRWSGHSIFLKYLPPKVCHDFVMKRW